MLSFPEIQRHLRDPSDPDEQRRPDTIIVLPSISMDRAGLAKIPGVRHYEERLLVFLQLLRRPTTQLIYLTSDNLDDIVVEYALDLVSSLPNWHARRRLKLLNCGDQSPIPLTEKILLRPDLIDQLRQVIGDPLRACLLAFNGSPAERDLAVALGVPLFTADPDLADLGTKSGAREILRESGVPVPNGFERLRDKRDVAEALAELRARDSGLRQAVIKINNGFGAGGNALFSFDEAPQTGLSRWIEDQLSRRVTFASPPDTWEDYEARLTAAGGIVECFIVAGRKHSPSVQLLLSPSGEVSLLSTQDQVLSGPLGQIFVGGSFPADARYRREIQRLALRAGRALAGKSVIGPLSIDFLAVLTAAGWQIYGVEINLRMGGSIPPYFLLNGLVEGTLDAESGGYLAADKRQRCYFATDRLQCDDYRVLSPAGVVDTALRAGLHYRADTMAGTAFYMLGALEVGRLGLVAIDRTVSAATRRYRQIAALLDAEI